MPRLPLRDLEEALKNPASYRQKLLLSADISYGPTYFGALRDAIFKFHKTNNNLVEARVYLQTRLSRFRDRMRCTEIMDQLEWYAAEYVARGWPAFETRLRVLIPLPSWAPPNLLCSGEISRIDIVPTGGYAAWLMRSRGAEDWDRELCMPLVQRALEDALGVPSSEISIGIYSFEEQFVALCSYSESEINQAYSDLAALLKLMGF